MARDQWWVELSPQEIARAEGVTPRTIQRRVASGYYPGRKEGRRWVIPSPTDVAAKARGTTRETVRRQAARGDLPAHRGTEREIEQRYAKRPPSKLVDAAESGGRKPMSLQAADDWIRNEAPDWIGKLTHGGAAIPYEAAILLGDAGAPHPSTWDGVVFTPLSSGDMIVTITDVDGNATRITMPADVGWDLRRAAAAVDVEIEVEDTP